MVWRDALKQRFLLVTCVLVAGTAFAQSRPGGNGTLNLFSVQGRVEVQSADGTWRPQAEARGEVERGLRTGTGRVILSNPQGGRSLIGSASTLRIYSTETDFQSGQFLLDGPAAAFALGIHFNVDKGSRLRLDLSPDGSTRRLAVLQGNVRLSNGKSTVNVQSGQQVTLPALQLTAFREDDPWYAAVFTGSGAATVEALRGNVLVNGGQGGAARPGLNLNELDSLLTQEASWAEVGFTGGGYLRLTENSELKVLAIEKTKRGREVTLQLVKGSAWNVVQKGQGGYKISTPVVSTAVRGTKFRVDATGLVKVMEGEVVLPSEPGVNVSAGQQKAKDSPLQALQKDALDLFNEQRDAVRAQPFKLEWLPFTAYQSRLNLKFSGSQDVLLSAVAQPGNIPLEVSSDPVTGQYAVQGAKLPEGQYRVQVRAVRFGEVKSWNRPVLIDGTPPALRNVQLKRTGRVLELTGEAQDSLPAPMTLHVKQGEFSGQWQVRGAFRLLLPARRGDVTLVLSDQAGNQVSVTAH